MGGMRKKHPIRPEALALRIGCNKVTIYRALAGKGKPETACQIHFHSDGAIPCWTLRPDLWSEGQIPPLLAELMSHHDSLPAAS